MLKEKLHDKDILFHNDHKIWISQLDFYQEEIKFFLKELNNVLEKNDSSFSKMENVSEYQHILRIKQDHVDTLRHEINLHEKKIGASEDSNIDVKLHNLVKTQYDKFVEDFEFIKAKFKRFASHND